MRNSPVQAFMNQVAAHLPGVRGMFSYLRSRADLKTASDDFVYCIPAMDPVRPKSIGERLVHFDIPPIQLGECNICSC